MADLDDGDDLFDPDHLDNDDVDWVQAVLNNPLPVPPAAARPPSTPALLSPSAASPGSAPGIAAPLTAPHPGTPGAPSPPQSSAQALSKLPGRDPKRLRANESKYRNDISSLFAELAALTTAGDMTKINRRNVLQTAIRRLRQMEQMQQVIMHQQQMLSYYTSLPVDHRHLFLADATPQAIVSLDGRYLDANAALLTAYGVSIEALKAKTIFTKVECAHALADYYVIFQRLLARNPSEAMIEEEMDVQCKFTQAKFNPNGYSLTQYFKVYFGPDQRPAYVALRLTPRRHGTTEARESS